MTEPLTSKEAGQIAMILARRANEIATYKEKHSCESFPNRIPADQQMPASVEYALELEITRLRRLAERVNPPWPPEKDE